MEDLIEDLLALAREDEAVTDPKPADLAEIAQTCWKNVETTGATLVTAVDKTIYADEGRLMQLLENLSGNAVEHGGSEVTVTVGDIDDGFYIEDDGCGIPEDEYDDVFTPGYSNSDDGTGFGLSIVDQIVAAHGWEIRLTEGTSGGTRFEITGVDSVTE
jgi:signal transduction histidine kinase